MYCTKIKYTRSSTSLWLFEHSCNLFWYHKMCRSDQYERVNVQPQRLLPIIYKEVSRVSTNTIPSERTEGANNPETTASIWSILTFAWLSGILHIGGSRAIEQADLYCLQAYHTNYMTNQSTYTANIYRCTAHRNMTRLGTTKHYLLLHGAQRSNGDQAQVSSFERSILRMVVNFG